MRVFCHSQKHRKKHCQQNRKAVVANEVLANEVLANEVLANEVLANVASVALENKLCSLSIFIVVFYNKHV